eukprot:scaffold3967_cov126-Skeletonema_dohrnii-CCMP3373.AAC.5
MGHESSSLWRILFKACYAAPQDAKQLFYPRGKFAEGTVQDSGEIKQQCRMRKAIKEGRSVQNCIG